jgi:hypothetical protein
MKLHKKLILGEILTMSIIELDEPLIRNYFNDRFQIIMDIDGKKLLPNNKSKYFSFTESPYLLKIKLPDNNLKINVSTELFYKKKLCDLTMENCLEIVNKYTRMYDEGLNLKSEIEKDYIVVECPTH